MSDNLNIMVVDGSVVNRQFIAETLTQSQGVKVAGVAANGRIALAKMQHHPVDLVLLDLDTDQDDALNTLKKIQKSYPDIGVIPICHSNAKHAAAVIQALEMGALDLLTKPDHGWGPDEKMEFKNRLEPVLKVFWGKKHVRLTKRLTRDLRGRTTVPPPTPVPDRCPPQAPIRTQTVPPSRPLLHRSPRPQRIEVVVIGVSTGGPKALGEVIPHLPGNLGVPILLVQHMPPYFTEALARSLAEKSALQVREAEEGDILRPNMVFIAPGGRHMAVQASDPGLHGERERSSRIAIHLNLDPPVHSCRPSADVLFRSTAEVFGGRILAVIMTGMGQDGVSGIKEMKAKGCYCMTQSEESCVVYGMPRAVDEAGLSDEKVPLNELAARISAMVKNPLR